MKKVLMLASVASMIDQFNMQNIAILQEQGYEVHVAANFEQGSTSSNERVEQFKKELKEKDISYFQIDFSRNVSNIPQNIKAYKQIKKLLKDNKYEFIHCHSPIGGVCGRLAAKVTNTKVIYTAHGFHFYKGSPKLNWIIYYPIEKVLSHITDVLITINKEDYELAKKSMKAKRVEYVPGVGVDTNKFDEVIIDKNKKRKELGLSKDNIVLLSVGELNKNKNHEVIIRALAKLNNPNIHYIIAGRGNLESYLDELSKELNIEKQVHLLGFRTNISELYSISDIFCFPSYREGLSVALMEAMASGLPVICSKIRGNIDLIIDKKGGYLCNSNMVQEYEKSISELINNIDKRKKISEYNLNFIKSYNEAIVNTNMDKIYSLILGVCNDNFTKM